MEELEMTLMEGEEAMDKHIAAFERELTTVRTGRASGNILDNVKVEYYGAETPIKQLAAITIPESNQLYIKPFDKSIIKDIEKAIFASGLGLTPQSDSTGIRLVFPKMTEERRKELTKVVLKYEEQAKVQIRNTRSFNLLSLQIAAAVESITSKSLFKISLNVNSSNILASGFFLGSLS